MRKRQAKTDLSRRALLRGVACAGALAAPKAAAAQSAIDRLIRSPERGGWEDQFDAYSHRAAAAVTSNTPVLSPGNILNMLQAIASCQEIVANGGWPTVEPSAVLRLGVVDSSVEPLRLRLMLSGDLQREAGMSDAFDSYVDGAVRCFQARHGLPADGVVDEYTLKAMNVSAEVRLAQLKTNLDRFQNRPDPGGRYVMVNIPAASVEAVEADRVALRNTAIVGRTTRPTPILDSSIHEVILNPYWTAPRSIVQKDIIPLMQKDPTYLARNNIHLFDAKGKEVAPESVDWFAPEALNLLFRQDPGKINAMASTKINFHNPYAVYMHDTPTQGLFNKLMRFESSGCVRVQNVRDLDTWLLSGTPGWNRQRIEQTIASRISTPIKLHDKVPVHLVYITAWSAKSGIVQFRDDIYGMDGDQRLMLQTDYAIEKPAGPIGGGEDSPPP